MLSMLAKHYFRLFVIECLGRSLLFLNHEYEEYQELMEYVSQTPEFDGFELCLYNHIIYGDVDSFV